MDTLFEWGILILVGLIIYGVLRVLVHSWREASKNYNKKLSEDYRRAVEKHQLSDDLENEHDRQYRINNPERFKRIHGAKVIEMATPSPSIEKHNFEGWFDNDGAGHGGSFGGGGASGSWGSDDNSSSSSYDSGSSDSGGSDSSSSD